LQSCKRAKKERKLNFFYYYLFACRQWSPKNGNHVSTFKIITREEVEEGDKIDGNAHTRSFSNAILYLKEKKKGGVKKE
jgi:hypothetical protein